MYYHWTTSTRLLLSLVVYMDDIAVTRISKKQQILRLSTNEAKGPFGLPFLITQFSVSITHNSKMVGPIAKMLFGKR